jgi:cytochrome c553
MLADCENNITRQTDMRIHAIILGGVLAVGSTVAAGEGVDLSKMDLSKVPPAAAKKGLTFSKDIQPLLEASCTRCHGQDRPKAGLQLTSLDAVLKGGKGRQSGRAGR